MDAIQDYKKQVEDAKTVYPEIKVSVKFQSDFEKQ